MKALESKNKEHGFYGTTIMNGKHKITTEWPAAFEWVHKAVPVWTPAMIRDFLDGRPGRHLADEATFFSGVSLVDPERWMEEFFLFAKELGKEGELAGIRMRIQANKELKTARKNLENVRKVLEKLLADLAMVKTPDEFQKAQKADVEKKLAIIRNFLDA